MDVSKRASALWNVPRFGEISSHGKTNLNKLENGIRRRDSVCDDGLHALVHALVSLDPCGVTCDDGGKYAVCLPLVSAA